MGNKQPKSSGEWADRLDKSEIDDLAKMYKNLAQNSPGDTIDRDMFMKFFPLPGLLGSRLFQIFDSKDTGNIDKEEFITGVAKLCLGNSDEHMQFLFRMYDLNGDGYISHVEMEMLLNHFPSSVFTLYATDHPDDIGGELTLSDNTSTPARQTIKRRIRERVQFICNQAFAQHCGGKDSMDVNQFKAFMLANSELLGYFDGILQNVGIESIATEAQQKPRRPGSPERGRSRTAQKWRPSESTIERQMSRSTADNSINHNASNSSLGRGTSIRIREREWGMECDNCRASYTFCGICGFKYHAHSQVHFGASPPSCAKEQTLERSKSVPVLSAWHVKCTTPSCGWRSFRYCFQCGEEFRKSSYRGKLLETPLSDEAVYKEGFLFKDKRGLKNRRKRWFLLKRKLLKVFHSPEEMQRQRKPTSIIVLQDCAVEEFNDPDKTKDGLFGIQISPIRVEKKVTTLYAESRKVRTAWIMALRLAAGVRKFESYYLQKENIGFGRWSKVYRCVDKETKEEKAVKIIMKADLEENALRLLSSEIAILNVVDHPNIISVQDIFENRATIFIVMELLHGGELYKRIQGMPRFTELNCYRVILPLLQSIAYMHNMGIVHRDIKPENILCGDDLFDIKVADFGLSCLVLPEEVMKLPCGTLTYVAPEVLDAKGGGYSKQADLWSVGVIIHLLLRSRLPFDGKNKDEIIKQTLHHNPDLSDPTWMTCSKEARDVVRNLLEKDPRKRMTANEVLQHPWAQTMNVELAKAKQLSPKTAADKDGAAKADPETLQLGPHAL